VTQTSSRWHCFEAFGIELEYMIVDRATLDVLPIADRLLAAAAGSIVGDFEDGPITWSNELALHVIELKTTDPAPELYRVADQFQNSLERLLRIAEPLGATLLPGGMHPWMDPWRELQLWPHDSAAIYDAFNRIFDCRGHGWANLQSMHINLPFADDQEFGRLHAAIRLVLPLLPGLAASSPIASGSATGWMDYRMEVYRHNADKIPQVAGQIVPEAVFSQAAYHAEIFQPLYRAIAPWDPQAVLQQPFLNARGAIARFERGSIEIRVIDVQECPAADLAIAQLTVEVLRLLVDQVWMSTADQQAIATDCLAQLFRQVLRTGERTVVQDQPLLRALGLGGTPMTVGQIWRHLLETVEARAPVSRFSPQAGDSIRLILQQGPLARRILRECGQDQQLGSTSAVIEPAVLKQVYGRLQNCLANGCQLDSPRTEVAIDG